MTKKFKHLMSPLQVGNHLLKSRIISTPCAPRFIQENETYPTEGLIQHYANKAKGGAAIVHVSGSKIALDDSMKPPALRHTIEFVYDGDVNHYLSQLANAVHDQGSFATIVEKHLYDTKKYDISPVQEFSFSGSLDADLAVGQELTEAQIRQATEEMVERVHKLYTIGFDGVYLHMSYQAMLLGRSLSPLTNKRTDKYGGSFENRMRLAIETASAIKEACGKDFIIEASLTGEERDPITNEPIPGGWTIEDTIHYCEMLEGLVDIVHVRGWHIDNQQPLGFIPDTPPYLELAEKVKAANPPVKILSHCGFHDPYQMEETIAQGKVDLIGMARAWIANPNFGDLVADDREDDIIPCIRCNKCFQAYSNSPYITRCSVNPRFGIEHRYKTLIDPPGPSRKVAVVGGGPAGMIAATETAKRGHKVTIFEKSDELGGQLKITDYVSFKWPLRDYKDYLKHQVEKLGVEVRYNTEATPEMLDAEGFEAIYLAMGSVPRTLPIPGADGSAGVPVYSAVQVFGHEDELPDEIVIIGGGETALETGMHLAEHGHKVTIICLDEIIGAAMSPLHYRSLVMEAAGKLDSLEIKVNASANAIAADGVHYLDAEGAEQVQPAEAVIISVGSRPLREEALPFAQCDGRLFIIGDNCEVGSVYELSHQAYFAAMKI